MTQPKRQHIVINSELHARIKSAAAAKSEKLTDWVEKVLTAALPDQNKSTGKKN